LHSVAYQTGRLSSNNVIKLVFSFDVNLNDGDDLGISNDRLPVGTIPIIATSSPEYVSNVDKVKG